MKYIVTMMSVVILTLSGCGAGQKVKNDGPKAMDSPAAVVQAEKEISYVGAINDNLDIHMKLRFQGDKIMGSYYYGTVRVDLPLKGTIDKARQVELTEYDASGKSTGTFTGVFVTEDRLEGVWNNEKIRYFNKNRTVYPFYLEEESEGGNAKERTLGGKNKALWEGEWNRVNSSRSANSGADIAFATNNSFWFELHALNAGQTSRTSGMAVITEDGANFTDSKGKISFMLHDGQLTIVTSKERSGDGSLDFSGMYDREEVEVVQRSFKEMGVFQTEVQEQKFKTMVGEYYDQFLRSFQLTDEVAKDSSGIKVRIGYLRGLRSYMGGIIMVAPDDTMWAAVISGDKVIYFTNDPNSVEPPETIRYWKPREMDIVLFLKKDK